MPAALIMYLHACVCSRAAPIQAMRVRQELSSVKQRPQISVTRQSWLEVVETNAKGCF